MITKFRSNFAAKSSSPYKDFYDSTTGSGLLVLQNLMKILRDYKNDTKPTRGFNPNVISDYGKKAASFSETERYATILLDKMKIQEDTV